MRRSLFALFLVCLLVVAGLALVWNALPVRAAPQGNVYVVTRTDDPAGSGSIGNLSLRQAVIYANADPGSTIRLMHNGIYVLTDTVTGELLATADMTITTDLICIFPSSCPAVIQGKSGWNTRILEIGNGAHVSLSYLTIRYGKMSFGGGGGIYNSGVLKLTATRSTATQPGTSPVSMDMAAASPTTGR